MMLMMKQEDGERGKMKRENCRMPSYTRRPPSSHFFIFSTLYTDLARITRKEKRTKTMRM